MTVAEMKDQNDKDRIEECYRRYMTQKYGERPETIEFKWFDPADDIPDKGVMFVTPSRQFLEKKRDEFGLGMMLGLFRTARRKPPQAGWYVRLGSSWGFIAPTTEAALTLFAELEADLKTA